MKEDNTTPVSPLTQEDRKWIDERAMNYASLGKNYRGELLYDTKAYAAYVAGSADAIIQERRITRSTQPDTDSDPRHHVIPDEGWEWKVRIQELEEAQAWKCIEHDGFSKKPALYVMKLHKSFIHPMWLDPVRDRIPTNMTHWIELPNIQP